MFRIFIQFSEIIFSVEKCARVEKTVQNQGSDEMLYYKIIQATLTLESLLLFFFSFPHFKAFS